MIRIPVLDDHPMVRGGLRAVLAPEHDLQAVGSAADGHELRMLLARTRPEVIPLDLYHPGRDVVLTRRPSTSSPRRSPERTRS